jgi:alpha-L-rhamnosidase
MNSFNHYAYGAVAEWLYRYVAGIDLDVNDPGFHRILLHPQFDSRIGHVEATYDSPYGPITSEWKVSGEMVSWRAVVPPNTTALLYFPRKVATKLSEGGNALQKNKWITFVRNEGENSIYKANSGSYSFTIEH